MPGDPLRSLIDRAREGDDRALAEFVRRTQPAVWQLCNALGTTGEEDDLVQDVYTRALRALPSYRGDAPAISWLLAIARHVCADHVRRQQRRRTLLDRLKMTALVPTSTTDTGSLHDLIARLAPERRDAFVLTQIVGLSYQEAADTLDCPVGTIRSRVARARLELLEDLRQADSR